MKHPMDMHPRRDDLPAMVALHAAVSDLHDLIDLIEAIDDAATRKALMIWISPSRLKDLWGPTRVQ